MKSTPPCTDNCSASWKASCVPPRINTRMSVEARAGDHLAVAVVDQHFDRDLAVHFLERDLLRLVRHQLAERNALLLRDGQRFAGGVRLFDQPSSQVIGALFAGPARERLQIDLAAPGMEIEGSLCQLAELAEAAGEGQALDRMLAQILEHRAGEVAHVDEGELRQ